MRLAIFSIFNLTRTMKSGLWNRKRKSGNSWTHFPKKKKFLYKEYYVKEMSYKEIAETIGISVDAACCRLKRLNRKIRANFKGIATQNAKNRGLD